LLIGNRSSVNQKLGLEPRLICGMTVAVLKGSLRRYIERNKLASVGIERIEALSGVIGWKNY